MGLTARPSLAYTRSSDVAPRVSTFRLAPAAPTGPHGTTMLATVHNADTEQCRMDGAAADRASTGICAWVVDDCLRGLMGGLSDILALTGRLRVLVRLRLSAHGNG
jgi:hypothetical protein